MFDPTAFDNMKVVIEGALYDMDIIGEIVITDRNDLINMAKMSRKFDVSFQLPNSAITAKIEMESKLVNLAAELLQGSLPEKLSGCNIQLEFFFENEHKNDEYHGFEKILVDIWGEKRIITQTVEYNPLQHEKKSRIVIKVEFDRLIREEQMNDLVEMTNFMMTTLQHLQTYQSGK